MVVKWIVLIFCFLYFFSRTFKDIGESSKCVDIIANLIVCAAQIYAIYWMFVTINKFW
jgi:hypothetical protein